LCEADLRTAVASLLRTKLRGIGGKAEKYKYRVTCEKRVAGVIADILIWRGKNPRFWIELKDTGRFRKALAEADWKKLQAFCPKCPTVKAGYFIYVARKRARRKIGGFPIKRSRATLRFWAIPIVLEDCVRLDFEPWNREYKRRVNYGSGKPLAKAASA